MTTEILETLILGRRADTHFASNFQYTALAVRVQAHYKRHRRVQEVM